MTNKKKPFLCKLGFHNWCYCYSAYRHYRYCNDCFVEREGHYD